MQVRRATTFLAAAVTSFGLYGLATPSAFADSTDDGSAQCVAAAQADSVPASDQTTACGYAAGGDMADCKSMIATHSTSDNDSTAAETCGKAAPVAAPAGK